MTTKVERTTSKEAIFNCFMNVKIIQNLFEDPRSSTIDKLKFVLKEEGCTEFDYDTDSGQSTSRIYEVDGIFIRLNGAYYSYNGLTLYSWEFVQPKTVQKVEYVKV
jgi:hypothetical protein